MTKVLRAAPLISLAATVAAVSLLAAMSQASAENACREAISATGKAANPANYDPPKHYNMEKLAKDRAIAAWRALVANKCPHDSNLWWRARNRKVSCEGYAGGTGCEASATPARRIGL